MADTLILDPNFEDADAFFGALTEAHKDLSRTESDALNARLIFVLANQIGDRAILGDAIQTAKAAGLPA